MCSEVMRTPNIPLPLCLGCQSPALLHMSFLFQVVMDSFRPSENRPGFRGCLLHFHVQSLWLWNIVSVFFVSLPEFIPWQCASGSVGAPDISSQAAACQNPSRGTLSVPWQMRGGGTVRTRRTADRATRGIGLTFNKEHRLAVCYDRAGCDESISL